MILMRNLRRTLGVASLLVPALALSACGGESTADGEKPQIVVGFYALEYAAQQVVGDAADVVTLTEPGVDAHGLELSPSQVASVGSADLVIYLEQFQAAVDDAIAQSGNEHVLEVGSQLDLLDADEEHSHDHGDEDHDHAEGEGDHSHEESEEGHDHSEEDHAHEEDGHSHEEDGHSHEEDGHDHSEGEGGHDHDHGDHDPHFWQDPNRMAKLGGLIADELTEDFPEIADQVQQGADDLSAEMATLDEEFSAGLAQCSTDTFVTTHQAFGYLTDQYGLTEAPLTGVNPEDEASPTTIAQVQDLIQEHGLTTIFFEPLGSSALADSLANDLGIETAILDPIEGVTEESQGEDYPSIMRANLEALRSANDCQ